MVVAGGHPHPPHPRRAPLERFAIRSPKNNNNNNDAGRGGSRPPVPPPCLGLRPRAPLERFALSVTFLVVIMEKAKKELVAFFMIIPKPGLKASVV